MKQLSSHEKIKFEIVERIPTCMVVDAYVDILLKNIDKAIKFTCKDNRDARNLKSCLASFRQKYLQYHVALAVRGNYVYAKLSKVGSNKKEIQIEEIKHLR